MGPSLQYVDLPIDAQLEKINLSLSLFCQHISITNSFLVRGGTSTCLGWDFCPAFTRADLCADSVSVSLYVPRPSWVWKVLFPWSHLSSLALAIFPPPLPYSPYLWKEGSDENIVSRTDVPRSLTLCISIVQLWTPVLVPAYYKKKLLWWGLSHAVICTSILNALCYWNIYRYITYFKHCPIFFFWSVY